MSCIEYVYIQFICSWFELVFNGGRNEKVYHYMARRFHPDKNIGLDTSEMIEMTNKAKFGLQDQLRIDDASREEERV